MNQHKITFVETKQLSDGQVAVATHCCGDPSTKSWLTMAAEVVIDPVRRQESIDFHANRVATLHESMQAALATLPNLIGTVRHVTLTPSPVSPEAQTSAVQ
jgi:hypothetical protein